MLKRSPAAASVSEKKAYRIGWVTEPGRDYRALLQLAGRIEFLTTSYEVGGEQVAESIRKHLEQFDFEHDIFAPSGRVLPNWILSSILAEQATAYNMAIYTYPTYTVFHYEPGGRWWLGDLVREPGSSN